jgi:hypothetical protein
MPSYHPERGYEVWKRNVQFARESSLPLMLKANTAAVPAPRKLARPSKAQLTQRALVSGRTTRIVVFGKLEIAVVAYY